MNPGKPPMHLTRQLDQLRERIRYLHHGLSTEKVYFYWVRVFVCYSKLAELKHRMHLRNSTPKWARRWAGFGCFHRPHHPLTGALACGGGIACFESSCSVHSKRLLHWLGFTSRCRFTRCAIHLPRTCCRQAPARPRSLALATPAQPVIQ